MATEARAGRGRWREGGAARQDRSSGPTRAKKWFGAAVLSALLFGVLGVVGWLISLAFFPNEPRPVFVPFWVAEYQKKQIAPIIGMGTERARLLESKVFRFLDDSEESTWNPALPAMETRLGNLKNRKPDEAVVVYISAYAMVDGSGKIQILAASSDPYEIRSMLPLRTVLTRLNHCPARSKLLVLDIMKPAPYPFDLGGTPDGVADLVRRDLFSDEDPKHPVDPNLLVLCACSPGESSLWSEALGESVFGHYFREGLIDVETDADHDGYVSVKELSDYVARKVEGWTGHFRGVRQRPVLLGTGPSFELASVHSREPAPPPKAVDTARADGKDKSTAKEKADDKLAGKATAEDATKGAEKKAKPASPTDELGYPEWLLKGWQLREAWWKGKESKGFPGAAAPRVLRRLEATLLRAERAWRGESGGRPAGDSLSGTISELQERMDEAQTIPQPPIRSVGQARAHGISPAPAQVAAMRNLLESRRGAGANPEAQAAQKKAAGEILAALKDKTNPGLELAGIIVEAVAEQRLDAPTIIFLDGLVAESKARLDVLELRLLRDLARRAAEAGPRGWSEDAVRLAWTTTELAEQAIHRPASLAWVRGLLDRAEAKRHAARVLLLSQVNGYASWDQIQQAWKEAETEFGIVINSQQKLEEAGTVLSRARAILPAYLTYLHATKRTDLVKAWSAAAEATVTLDRRLKRPDDSGAESPPTQDQLELLNNELAGSTASLNGLLDVLQRPFLPESVREAVARSEIPHPDPRAGLDIEALLGTPYLEARDRVALLGALRALDRRLAELPPRASSSDSDPANRGDAVRSEALRRARRLATLLEIVGEDATAKDIDVTAVQNSKVNSMSQTSGADASSEWAPLEKTWMGLAATARFVYDGLSKALAQPLRPDGDDRLGWVAPVFLVPLDKNPIRDERRREASAHAAWLAEDYRHQDHDLNDGVDPIRFYDTAALECARIGKPAADRYLELGTASAAAPVLTAKQPSEEIGVQVNLHASDPENPRKAIFEVISIGDPRLRASLVGTAERELVPERPTTVGLKVEWDEHRGRSDLPPPAGLILQATLAGGRSFHLLVPVRPEWRAVFPTLVLSSTKGEPTEVPFERFRLRPLPGRQPFYVFVSNPAPTPRQVVVEIVQGETVLATSDPKGLTVPGNATPVVPGFGPPTPAPKDGQALPEIAQGLRLRLRDASGAGGQEYDSQPLQPTIASPEEYVEVTNAQFVPARNGTPNQLRVVFRALPQMTGPDCSIELVLPRDKELFPALRGEPQGGLRGVLERGKELTLTADDIQLAPSGSESGVFQINIDGNRRAMWYRTNFVEEGGNQRATEERTPPRVRFRPELNVKPGQPATLRVRFEVDKAPPETTLAFTVGRYINGKYVEDHSFRDRAAKRRHIGFEPKGEGGALLFEAAVEDWEETFDVRGLRGNRHLHAFLLDPKNKTLADWGTDRILDDVPPKVAELQVKDEIDKGASGLDVKAVVVPPLSGIKDVSFLIGPKEASEADFAKAEAEGKTTKGKKSKDDDPRVWEARLRVSADAAGKFVVTARATSAMGLNDLIGTEVRVREPDPEPTETAAKPAKPKPGSIEGTVFEGNIAQGGLTVYLVEVEPKDPAKSKAKEATTRDDGSFSFKDLPAGQYMLLCEKGISKRKVKESVTVEEGEVARKKLELLR